MRFLHISDLHIGKQLNGYRLRENQEKVLAQIVEYAKEYRPDAVLICGDIYDKSVPSGEAQTIFDAFLKALAAISPKIPVLIIAGNHDSPERLNYASGFLEDHRIYISTMVPRREEEYLKKITLEDKYGQVHFYLMPFLKPGYVRPLFPEKKIETYQDAVEAVLMREKITWNERNVLLSHQFYTAGEWETQTCDSEDGSFAVGGVDRISTEVLEGFDYVALGHLHGQQKVGSETVRYCGTPYKYSVSEEHHSKGAILVTLNGKGETVQTELLPLTGLQDVRKVRGGLAEILESADESNCHDYVSITVTDEEEPYDLREQIEQVYDHMLELRIDNKRTKGKLLEAEEEMEALSPMEAFGKFYQAVRHSPMTEEEEAVMEKIFEEVREVCE